MKLTDSRAELVHSNSNGYIFRELSAVFVNSSNVNSTCTMRHSLRTPSIDLVKPKIRTLGGA